MLCQVVQVGLNIWMAADSGFGPIGRAERLRQAVYHIFHTARALQNIADILLFVTFVELGSGFVFCLNGAKKTPIRRYLRYTAFLWAVILLTLALMLLAIRTEADVTFYQWASAGAMRQGGVVDWQEWEQYQAYIAQARGPYVEKLARTSRLHNALNICLWVTSFPTLGFASYVLHKAKENIILKKAATLYLVSTVLTFCRLLVTMAIYISEYDSYTVLGVDSYIGYTDIETFILPLIEAFFNFVLMFIALTLLFALAIRKRRGLWSKSQMAWDAPNKLREITTSSGTPGYSDDGLQEYGFCLQPQQAGSSSLPAEPQPAYQPQPSSPTSPTTISPGQRQQASASVDPGPGQTPLPEQNHIRRRPLAPSILPSPTEPGSPSSATPSTSQEQHPLHDGGFMRRQRTIEELDAQKVLLLDGPLIHRLGRRGPDEEQEVADGFQMQNNHGAQPRRVEDVTGANFQQNQSHDPVAESDTVADGFQMQNQDSSELPSYAETGGETTTTRTGFGYLREKDDQDKRARGRARSF
ncbi:hypothetical protein B0T21DRAFT_378192 [Apiosordaria backusii]|uniref:Uncharacterized protein n=1 Tax=Apiosordaria backusii TaxID=314023 RepID=A0AA39ZSR8_9PEZI|nr:hypothetical protein B0T21DRAFT_378192 [Apiosordaria backusii]